MNIFKWKSTFSAGGLQIARLPAKIKDMFSGRNDLHINEILFYGAENEEQRRKVGLNNLFCIYYLLIHANNSIEICAPSLSSNTIIKSLIDVKQKGDIKIRIAIYNNVDYGDLRTFTKYGMEVKAISSAVQLEHEFILIDALSSADAVALVGSVDYEVARVNRNRDATVITSEPAVVSTLKSEFERVWNSVPDIMTVNIPV